MSYYNMDAKSVQKFNSNKGNDYNYKNLLIICAIILLVIIIASNLNNKENSESSDSASTNTSLTNDQANQTSKPKCYINHTSEDTSKKYDNTSELTNNKTTSNTVNIN